jgi:hypothetical protein
MAISIAWARKKLRVAGYKKVLGHPRLCFPWAAEPSCDVLEDIHDVFDYVEEGRFRVEHVLSLASLLDMAEDWLLEDDFEKLDRANGFDESDPGYSADALNDEWWIVPDEDDCDIRALIVYGKEADLP